MANIKDELAKLKEEDADLITPTISATTENPLGESLMLFGSAKHRGKRYRLFYGIGIVYRVVKGENQDLIYVNFGFFKEHRTRLVLAYENHARRQTLTLKRGQCCQVYGLCRYYTTEFELNGEKRKGVRLGLYARAISGWYVPTMMDIRKMPTNEDLVEPSEKEEELQQTLTDVLNEFLTGKGEENE